MCRTPKYSYNVFVITINDIPMGVYSIEMKTDHQLYINNTHTIPEYRGNGLYEVCLKARMSIPSSATKFLSSFSFVTQITSLCTRKQFNWGFRNEEMRTRIIHYKCLRLYKHKNVKYIRCEIKMNLRFEVNKQTAEYAD